MSHMSHMAIGLILLAATSVAASQEVVISCDVGLKWAYVSAVNVAPSHVVLEGKTRTKSVISTASLPPLDYSASQKLTPHSTEPALSAQCGPFTFVLSSTSISTADVASVFSVWENEKLVLGPLAIGQCALQQTVWGSCPADWVRAVSLRWDSKAASIAFDLDHSFQEFRARPNKSLERTRER
jgi:hypothetical protein